MAKKETNMPDQRENFTKKDMDPNAPTRLKDNSNPVKTGADKVSSPSEEEANKDAEGIFTNVEEKDGVKTVTSSVSEEEANKTKSNAPKLRTTVNETEALTGHPGQVDLTQGGALNSDKSVRADRTIEEINKELEEKAGPNPTPNRDGNEMLKAELGMSPAAFLGIDRKTNKIASDLKSIREKGTLTEADKVRLNEIEDELKGMARV